MKYYIHYVPGRLRIESPALYENPAKIKEFEAFIKGVGGILSVETNAPTGSATIHFDEKKINREQLIDILEKHNYFRLAEAETCDERIEKETGKALKAAEKIIEITGGGIGEE